ncbi:MAG: hypothetical protein OXG72_11830, partial [Acidobacteria bacterium]|nr:hypothetical protein [Acidobacteriota bacterium]
MGTIGASASIANRTSPEILPRPPLNPLAALADRSSVASNSAAAVAPSAMVAGPEVVPSSAMAKTCTVAASPVSLTIRSTPCGSPDMPGARNNGMAYCSASAVDNPKTSAANAAAKDFRPFMIETLALPRPFEGAMGDCARPRRVFLRKSERFRAAGQDIPRPDNADRWVGALARRRFQAVRIGCAAAKAARLGSARLGSARLGSAR